MLGGLTRPLCDALNATYGRMKNTSILQELWEISSLLNKSSVTIDSQDYFNHQVEERLFKDDIKYWVALENQSNILEALVDDDLQIVDTSKTVVEKVDSSANDQQDNLKAEK